MVRNRSKSQAPTPQTDESLSYEELSGSGGRPSGVGGRRNVAPGAYEYEPEDYSEQNQRNVMGEGGKGIVTGNYENDYGPGARGHRNPQFHTEPQGEDAVLRREDREGEVKDTMPSGAWQAQRMSARLKNVRSKKIRARPATGRGVGVKTQKKETSSTIAHPAKTRSTRARSSQRK